MTTRKRAGWLSLAVIALLLAASPWWLPALGGWLVVRDRLEPADFILVLGGDVEVRPAVACWAYHQGLGKKVLFSQAIDRFEQEVPNDPPERELIPAILRLGGVPPEVIIPLPGAVDGTLCEAVRLADYLQEHPGSSVLVVTTSWHTRRAGWILRNKVAQLGSIRMLPAPSPSFEPTRWWRSPNGLEMVMAEYLKVLWYLVRG